MEYSSYPHILSDREQREWIEGCPVQVKRVKLTVPAPESGIILSAVITPCGGFSVESVEAAVEFTDARHKKLPGPDSVVFSAGESEAAFEGNIPDGAVYGYVTVKSVKYSGGMWKNPMLTKGSNLPDQKIIWQTDPLYEQIRRECNGVVEAKYYPDEPIAGAWRCACGQVNLAEGEKDTCGACGCGKKWLDNHFDEKYLEEQAREAANRKPDEIKKKIKKQSEGISDKTKFILILAAAAVVITGIAMSPFIQKKVNYARGESFLKEGKYDEAIAQFTMLEGFSDSEDRLYEANYKKAQAMTGLSEVNMVSSRDYPCYKITEDGVLEFSKDKYTGSWDHFIIPDVVDGVVVRELEKSFFLNCKEMKSVTISDCVEVLGEQTFFNCESLTTVNFGVNVREVGARCFINCTALEEIVIPDTVEKIGLRAFNSCLALKKVTLGTGITTIPSYLFSCCFALESVAVRAPITSVEEYAFSECYAFTELEYAGTAEQWSNVTVAGNNDALLAAEIKYVG